MSLDFWTCTSFLCTQCQQDWGHSHRHRWGLEEGDRKQLPYSPLSITENHLLLQWNQMPTSPEPSSWPAVVLALHSSFTRKATIQGRHSCTHCFIPTRIHSGEEEKGNHGNPSTQTTPNPFAYNSRTRLNRSWISRCPSFYVGIILGVDNFL